MKKGDSTREHPQCKEWEDIIFRLLAQVYLIEIQGNTANDFSLAYSWEIIDLI